MEESRQPVGYMDEEIWFRRYLKVVSASWWKILILSFAGGVVSVLVTLTMPNIYESAGTIVPALEEGKPNISSLGLGALASTLGISVGGSAKMEDLEALFMSRELTIRVFRKYNLWPYLSPDNYDPNTGKIKIGWRERLRGYEGDTKVPGDWDALRAAEDRLNVSVSRKLGTLTVSFESRSAKGSREIVAYYLEEAKTRLQEKALDRANRNKNFLEGQFSKTVDPIIRDRLYTLYSQEVEREMLARNREQFGFTILDPPMVPDRKSNPHRTRIVIAATLFSFLMGCVIFGFLQRKRITASLHPASG